MRSLVIVCELVGSRSSRGDLTYVSIAAMVWWPAR